MSRYYSSERYEGTGERTKLRRGRGLFCGLCEGIGKWMGLPPWIFRGIFIALIFAWGFFSTAGLYLLACILIPSEY
ncbi:MAG: PspC domain-containing protein [Sphaerochaetaceae bacterium]|jgi:phage shock protein PspC (stress-responsive transcriptional regulator)|nr:PspC domain-containing protein [Sphaerochaetaceae bacterium]NLY07868.1 PspC domain-containing protein [Spirochaetales bacterium]